MKHNTPNKKHSIIRASSSTVEVYADPVNEAIS